MDKITIELGREVAVQVLEALTVALTDDPTDPTPEPEPAPIFDATARLVSDVQIWTRERFTKGVAIQLDKPLDETVTVRIVFVGDITPDDYILTQGGSTEVDELTFDPGVTEVTAYVRFIDDGIVEGREHAWLHIESDDVAIGEPSKRQVYLFDPA